MSPPRLSTVAASVDIFTVLVACVSVVVGHVVVLGHVVLLGHAGASIVGLAVVGDVGCVVCADNGHSMAIILPAELDAVRRKFII